MHPSPHRLRRQRGPPPQGGGALSYKQFMATVADDASPEDAQRQYQDYMRTMGGGAIGGAPKSTAGGVNAITHQLPLPDKIVSGIIGKGGQVIKEIIHRSGAEVKISQKDPANPGERVVSITGAPDSVAAAQRLISERCREIEQQITRNAAGGTLRMPHPCIPCISTAPCLL